LQEKWEETGVLPDALSRMPGAMLPDAATTNFKFFARLDGDATSRPVMA
jgi:hypothetical protein